MSRIEKHLVQDVQMNIILHTETSWPKEIFTEPVEPNDGEVALHKRKVVSIDVFVATGDDSYVKAIINRSDFNRIQTEMSTTQQAIEALDELLRDAFMYIRHNPGAGSDPLLVRLKGSKAIMAALASVPQQDAGACRSVPSPVGQEPVAWTKEDLSAIITQSDRIASIEDGGALRVMAEKYTIPLFTHPPKAGVLTDEEIERIADRLYPIKNFSPGPDIVSTAINTRENLAAKATLRHVRYLSPKP